jgi:hypothetical protein
VFFTTSEGLWSWDVQTPTVAALLLSATGLSELSFSHNGLYVVGVDAAGNLREFGAGIDRLIASGDSYHSPAVSADGSRVVYEDNPTGGAPAVVEEWVEGEASPRQISPLGAEISSRLLGTAGAELQDVFLVANEPLVAQDRNATATAIFDARTDGGFPRPAQPVSELRTPNPTNLTSSPYPASLSAPAVQPAALPADTSHPRTFKPKPVTMAQKLANALKACRKEPKSKRKACERRARRRYAKKAATIRKQGKR